MDLEDIKIKPDVEDKKPILEYTSHEEYTMQLEREANRKLKAEIRKRRKLGFKKMMMGEISVYYKPLYLPSIDYPLTPDDCYD